MEENKLSETNKPTDSAFEKVLDMEPLQQGLEAIRASMRKVIVGQDAMVKLILAALLADGHVLLEGRPGLAKTLTAKLMAKLIDTDFSRIQFTPDLMPSDVLGTSIFNMEKRAFEFKKGAIFSNIILIDEINRAPAKTQAALFEVMEERQVTMDGHQHDLDPPFMIIGTQNPIDMEGTYSLPEAQLDRFIFKIELPYPSVQEEFEILRLRHAKKHQDVVEELEPILSIEALQSYRALVKQVRVSDDIFHYIAQVVHATRVHPDIYLGASPRASIALMEGAQAIAAMGARDYVIPEDVHEVLPAVLTHRIVLTAEKEMEGIDTAAFLQDLMHSVKIPR